MDAGSETLPDDIEELKATLVAARAEVASARAQRSDDQALIAHLKLQIEKLNRDRYGPRSERAARLLDQLELQLAELEATATEDELAAEMAAAKTTKVASFTRQRPSRKPFPEHLPRERVIVPGPTACACCGGGRLSKLGEDITETLEVIPKSWKVIQHVREKFTCRDCEKISQAPAPFHVIARGWAGPSLLAMILFEKFGQHQPLNRQAERYAKEGLPLSLSTLADQVGGCKPGQLHRDEPGRTPGPILEAACWVHARRPFFVMADLAENARRKAQGKKPPVISPLALDVVRRIDALFEIERAINGQSADRRKAVRQELSAPLIADLEAWMREQRAKLSRGNDVAKAMDYMLASQACGSTSLSLAVMISVVMTAARSAPRSEPAKSHDFRPSAITRSYCPCRAGVRSSVPLASLFWPQGRHPARNAASDRPISEHPGSGGSGCYHC